MKIYKVFTQKHVSNDCEARNWAWHDTNEPYDEIAEKLATEWDGWLDAVRVVEKVFDSDTFEITVNVIKEIQRVYNYGVWTGEAEEIIY